MDTDNYFWTVTKDGLILALGAVKFQGDHALGARLLHLYWELKVFDEVPAMLTGQKSKGFTTAILSNSSPDMLDGAVRSAEFERKLRRGLSVQSVGVFKPDRRIFDMAGAHFGCAMDQVWFVSSNGWNDAATSGYGFNTAWVNRAGNPVDRLPWAAQHMLQVLTDIPTLAGAR